MVAQFREYTENYWTVYIKSVNFRVCELCLNLKKCLELAILWELKSQWNDFLFGESREHKKAK